MRSTSVNQGGEVEQEFGSSRGVGSSHNLHVETGVHPCPGWRRSGARRGRSRHQWHRRGCRRSTFGSVADFDGPFNVHLSSVPVDLVGGVVGQPIGGHERSAHVIRGRPEGGCLGQVPLRRLPYFCLSSLSAGASCQLPRSARFTCCRGATGSARRGTSQPSRPSRTSRRPRRSVLAGGLGEEGYMSVYS